MIKECLMKKEISVRKRESPERHSKQAALSRGLQHVLGHQKG